MAKPLQFTQAQLMAVQAFVEYGLTMGSRSMMKMGPGNKIGLFISQRGTDLTKNVVISRRAAVSGLKKLKEADRG